MYFVASSFTFSRPLGKLVFPFYGSDCFLKDGNQAVFFSKSSYSSFINLFFKQTVCASGGFFVELLLVGLGFRFLKLGGVLLLKVGHTHYVKVVVPDSLHIIAYKKRIVILGITSSAVKQFISMLICFRRPDVYKNKGIQLVGSLFRLKPGKQK